MRKVKIAGIGKYLPETVITSDEIDAKLGLKSGWTEKKSGVKKRHYAGVETASEMGAKAVLQALQAADLTLDDIDCLVSVSGTMEQPIPCTAALMHEKLQPQRPIPAFDINSTCLSFVTGLDVMSQMVHAGGYQRVVLVSSDIASVGINPKQKESYVLFGDAAVACIIERTPEVETSRILVSNMETYSKGAHLTEIRGGGTKLHPNKHKVEDDYLFDMDGKKVFRMSSKVIGQFVRDLLNRAALSIEDLTAVVPHQASGMALRMLGNKLGIQEHRLINVIGQYGNAIAASIPLALADAVEAGKIARGDTIMLLGTSAGLSLGGMLLVY
ncbi:3-oxoacyl-[acyl-carrier-protein] synthase-3 [Evansella caseinilytica]|uniref:3-oxoacyl-[acyl-carrier-protein] synthase-3 n=1 Tax=Evansella caseinilytica TaxID=1503961 RepID=A0A1H3IMW8_9BACI|nr:3-oxoacyl-[acyl-carrier-protein] synthase-3 [Evansella caseinilytica]